MLPSRRPSSSILLSRAPGFERWLVLGSGRTGDNPLPRPIAEQVLTAALADRRLARALCDLLHELGDSSSSAPGGPPQHRLERWLSRGRLRVVERKRALPKICPGGPVTVPRLEPPPVLEPEPILIDDAPTLRRCVALVVLDFDGDGEPITNLPLFAAHRNGEIDDGRTDGSGKLEIEQLPPDHCWSVFSGRNPDA